MTTATGTARTHVVDATPPILPPVACVDIGSTFTKLAAVERGTGRLLATVAHPTTADPGGTCPPDPASRSGRSNGSGPSNGSGRPGRTRQTLGPTRGAADVLDGLDSCQRALTAAIGAAVPAVEEAASATEAVPAEETVPAVLACSSAGGGLRLAVVGQERLVSTEAGRRVALSAGARVVLTCAGRLDAAQVDELRAASPDVLLLAGGTDGGDDSVLLHNARALAGAALPAPVVVAGNAEARDQVCAVLEGAGRTVHPTANVLPDIGEINPGPARAVIREVFLRHVIGGKGLSAAPRFASLVRAVTPDAVLDGVAVLADALHAADPDAGDVLVVDVGGATTDVYSARVLPAARATTDVYSARVLPAAPARHVVGDQAERRTVEGDLGVRWSAPGVVEAAVAQRLVTDAEVDVLREAAARRAAEPAYLPVDAAEAATDLRLAVLAATVAVRRHLRAVEGGIHGVSQVVCSGGVFRHAGPAAREAVFTALRVDPVLGGPLGRAAFDVDQHYVLAAAGLLRADDPGTARSLVVRHLAAAAPRS